MSKEWERVPATDAAWEILLRLFATEPARLLRLRRESVNTVFVCRPVRPGRDLVLKRLGRAVTDTFLGFQDRCLVAAADAGIPVPRAVPARTGSTTVRSEDGAAWQLTERLSGRAYQDGDAVSLLDVAEHVGRLHTLDAGTVPPPSDNPTRDVERWLEHGLGELKDLEAAIALSETGAARAREVARGLAPVVTRAVEELGGRYSSLPRCLTHGELTGSNVLVSEPDHRVVGVLDWDGVFERPRVYDLARGALSFARRRRDGFEVDPVLVGLFLDAATGDLPLLEAELAAVVPVLELFLAGTARHVHDLRTQAPDSLDWSLRWGTTGAGRVREVMTPVLKAYRSRRGREV